MRRTPYFCSGMRIIPILVWMAVLLVAGCRTTTKESTQNTATNTPVPAAPTSAPDQSSSPPTQVTEIQFDKTEHDFGKIRAGEKVTYRFKFRNTGALPLQITDVKPSCGCTASDYTRTPVAPGAEGFIEVVFDSEGRSGTQMKTVTVYANTEPPTHILRFKGEVMPNN